MAELDVIGGVAAGPRRRRSAVERRRVVEETFEAGASVARFALKHGVNANQVFQWRRLYRDGRLGAVAESEVHTHTPGHEACLDCGGRLRELGEDVAEMLEYVRACFKVIRHVRPKLSCDACDRIVQATAPPTQD